MKRGFTLVEMLVVVAIILLLAGILLPVLNGVRQQAWKARARADCAQIVNAWKTRLQDHRQFPAIVITNMSPAVIAVLNSGTQSYLEFSTNEMARGFLDPWGTVYEVRLDNGRGGDAVAYDDEVTTPWGEKVGKAIIAWSKGADGSDAAEEDRKDDVRSWSGGK